MECRETWFEESRGRLWMDAQRLEDKVRKLVVLLMSDRDQRLWVEVVNGEVGGDVAQSRRCVEKRGDREKETRRSRSTNTASCR